MRQTDFFVILGHFLPFYPSKNLENHNLEKWQNHLVMSSFNINVYQKPQSCHVCFLRFGMWQKEFSVILCHLLTFYTPLITWLIEILKKWKKHPKILSLHKCVYTINKDMITWDIRHDWAFFFGHFGLFLALLSPLTIWKIKILKN